MLERLQDLIADALSSLFVALRRLFYRLVDAISAARVIIVAVALFAAAGYAMVKHPPIKTVASPGRNAARMRSASARLRR